MTEGRHAVARSTRRARLLLCARGSKRFESPDLLRLIMAKHVAVSILGHDAKIGGAGGIPAVLHLRYRVRAAVQDKAQRPFVGPVA